MATVGGFVSLLMLLVCLTLSQILPTLSTRSFQDIYETSALLRNHPSSTLGLFSDVQTQNTTFATKLHRVRRDTAGLSPKELFVRGVQSSVARASRLARSHRGLIYSTLDARSGVFSEEFGHAMEIQFGTPAQGSLLLLVDTASSLAWIQCAPCPSCTPQSAPLFDPSTSKSYLEVPCTDNLCNYLQRVDPITSGFCAKTCQYKVTYGDGSYSNGQFAKETLTLNGGSNSVPNVYIGCGRNNYGIDGYNGILGLDSSSLSFAGQLGKFSICLLPTYATASSPIVFGDPSFPGDSPNPSAVTVFQNPVTKVPYYYVDLAYISVNGEFINVPADAFKIDTSGNGGVMFDTGTTFTVLHEVVFDALVAQLQVALPTNIKVGDAPCWPFPSGGGPVPNLPFIEFQMFTGNMGLDIQGTYQVLGPNICLAMARSTDTSATVIGNYQMQNQFMIFDPQAGQVQFNMYDCSKLAS